MKVKKSISIMMSIALTSSVLGVCSNTKTEESRGTETKIVSENSRKSSNELVVSVASEPEEGFDATVGGHGSMTRVLFSTLFKRDKNLGMGNDLASSYEVSEDLLTWTVKLREDVLFTDGEKLTSEDVIYTYEKAKESGSSIDLTMLDSVKAIDEYTVAFILNKPQSTFIEKMAYIGIVPKHAHNENFKDNPIGSGPYEFIQWDKGQ